MEDNYQQFRDNWERRPEPAFEERDWNALKKRLDQISRKQRGVGRWQWVAVPLLFLLLGVYLSSLLELRKANQTIAFLQLHRDTVLQTKVVYKVDTIFRTSVVEKPLIKYISSPYAVDYTRLNVNDQNNFKFFEAKPTLFSSINKQASTTKLNPFIPASLPPPTSAQYKNITNKPGKSDNLFAFTNLNRLSPLPPSLFPNLLLHSKLPASPTVEEQKKRRKSSLYAMRPKGFQFGLSGGWATPLAEEEDELKRHFEFSRAAQGLIEFSPALRIRLEMAYSTSNYETKRMDETIGVPVIEPPLDDLDFIKAEISHPYLQYSAGLEYLIRRKGKFKPFIGMDYAAIRRLSAEVVYDFKNEAIGTEWSEDLTFPGNGLQINYFLLRTGFEYKLAKHWNWRLQASYRGQWRETTIQTPKTLGINGGLFYRF